MEQLKWDNYLSIQNDIENLNIEKEYFSSLSLLMWTYYEYEIKYEYFNKDIIFFTRNLKKHKNWKISVIYYDRNSNKEDILKQAINLLKSLNNDNVIQMESISKQMIEDFNLNNLDIIEEPYTSNFIYMLENFKTYRGKKLQKKRNHLNFFIKSNHNYKIVDIKNVSKNEIKGFLEIHMKKNGDEYRKHELNIYEKIINDELNNDRYSGIVIYIDNEIKGLTLGFLRKNIYEIVIEKAFKDIRGLYQFLIQANLLFNDINAIYMDREDDGGIIELEKSKLSYYPEEIIKRFSINYRSE